MEKYEAVGRKKAWQGATIHLSGDGGVDGLWEDHGGDGEREREREREREGERRGEREINGRKLSNVGQREKEVRGAVQDRRWEAYWSFLFSSSTKP